MAAKTLREEIVMTPYGDRDFEVETYGHLHLMPRNAFSVWAIFGLFSRTDGGTLLYCMGADDMSLDECDSHYLDDLNALKRGNFDIVDKVLT